MARPVTAHRAWRPSVERLVHLLSTAPPDEPWPQLPREVNGQRITREGSPCSCGGVLRDISHFCVDGPALAHCAVDRGKLNRFVDFDLDPRSGVFSLTPHDETLRLLAKYGGDRDAYLRDEIAAWLGAIHDREDQ